MTAPTDQFADIAKRSQEAVTTAVRNWTDAVQSFTGNQPTLPRADRRRHILRLRREALAKQRELTQQAVAAGVKATKAVSDQAAKMTAQA